MTNAGLSKKQREDLLKVLQVRFDKNMSRHKSLSWPDVQSKVQANAEKLWALSEMEKTGGEPDVVGQNNKTGEYIFYDCSEQSPKGRRSLCYDREALESRKEHKPKNSALELAGAMGIEILTEEQIDSYRNLARSIPQHRAGYKHPPTSENAAAHCFAIAATTLCSSTTTAQNRIMRPEDSEDI